MKLLNSQAYMIPSLQSEGRDMIKNVRIENILSVIADEFSIKVEDLKSKSRKHVVVLPRQVVEYVFVRKMKYKLIDAGNVLGLNRDHSTVLHSIKTINNFCDTQPDFKERLKALLKKLKRYE